MVFKDYFYALDNQTYAIKSLQLWLAVLFISLKKTVSLNISVCLKNSNASETSLSNRRGSLTLPFLMTCEKAKPTLRHLWILYLYEEFEDLWLFRFTPAWMIISYLWPQIFIQNIRIWCKIRGNNTQEIQSRIQNEETRLTGCPLGPCWPRGPFSPALPWSPF